MRGVPARSTTIPRTGAFTRSRTRVRCAGRARGRPRGHPRRRHSYRRCRLRGAGQPAQHGGARRLAAARFWPSKGSGGFHLACDPRNAAAVERLRARKRRSDKPFALMARDLAAVEACAKCRRRIARRSLGWRRPIVILPRRPSTELPEAIAPGNRTLGVMLPYTPLHHLLFDRRPFDALVMTSGNLSEEPIVVDNGEARERIGAVADWFLTHNRDIYMRADDSVVRTFEGRERVLRRSRGYAPQTLDLGRTVPEILACGGELKNVFCLTKGRHAILSQHIGDLENYETLLFFEETLANLKKLFRVEPRAGGARPASALPQHQVRAETGGRAEDRRAAPSRAHRLLHGRKRPGRRGDRRGFRRHRIRYRRRYLGRRVSGGRLRRVRTARAPALRPAGRRRCRRTPALAPRPGVPHRRCSAPMCPSKPRRQNMSAWYDA